MNRQPRTRDARRAQGAGPGRDGGVSVTRRGATGSRNAAIGGQIAFAGGGLMNGPGWRRVGRSDPPESGHSAAPCLPRRLVEAKSESSDEPRVVELDVGP